MSEGLTKIGDAIQSKGAKVGTGIAAGGTSLFLVVTMLNGRLDEVNKRIDEKDKQIREYVDFRHDQVVREFGHVNDNQKEIKDILKVIEQRMYKIR